MPSSRGTYRNPALSFECAASQLVSTVSGKKKKSALDGIGRGGAMGAGGGGGSYDDYADGGSGRHMEFKSGRS